MRYDDSIIRDRKMHVWPPGQLNLSTYGSHVCLHMKKDGPYLLNTWMDLQHIIMFEWMVNTWCMICVPRVGAHIKKGKKTLILQLQQLQPNSFTTVNEFGSEIAHLQIDWNNHHSDGVSETTVGTLKWSPSELL